MRRKNPLLGPKYLSQDSRDLYQKIDDIKSLVVGSSKVPKPVRSVVRSAHKDFLGLFWGYQDIMMYEPKAVHSLLQAMHSCFRAVIDVYLRVNPRDPLGYIRKVLDSAEKSSTKSLLALEQEVRNLGALSLYNDAWSICKELLSAAAEAEAIVRERLG